MMLHAMCLKTSGNQGNSIPELDAAEAAAAAELLK